MDRLNRIGFVGRIVVLAEFVQDDARAVVHFDFMIRAFIIIRFDILIGRDEVEIMNRIEMAFDVLQALGRAFMVVERHARADDVQDGATLCARARLERAA